MTGILIVMMACSLFMVVVFTLRMRDIASEYIHIEYEAARQGIPSDTKDLVRTRWGYLGCVVFFSAVTAFALYNLIWL